MNITVRKEPDRQAIEVQILCPSEDGTVREIIAALNAVDTKLTGRRDGVLFRIALREILYMESVNRKVFLYTQDQTLETDERLYELEERLKSHSFFRASKAILINLRRVRSLRPELGSRLLLTMDNGEKIIVSRHYAGAIKNALGVN